MSDRELYYVIIGGLCVAMGAGLLLVVKGNPQARGDAWFVPVFIIMIFASIQHMNGA